MPNSIKYLELGEYELCIEKLSTELVELLIASPVKFTHFTNEKMNMNKFSNEQYRQIECHELEKIGEYNIKNNILIKIPKNLSEIIFSNNKSLVYEYIKFSNCDSWYRDSIYLQRYIIL